MTDTKSYTVAACVGAVAVAGLALVATARNSAIHDQERDAFLHRAFAIAPAQQEYVGDTLSQALARRGISPHDETYHFALHDAVCRNVDHVARARDREIVKAACADGSDVPVFPMRPGRYEFSSIIDSKKGESR